MGGIAPITAPVVGRRKAPIVVRARGTNASEVAGRRERRRLHRQRRELSIAREGKLRGIPLADFDGGFTRVRGPLGATIVGLDQQRMRRGARQRSFASVRCVGMSAPNIAAGSKANLR